MTTQMNASTQTASIPAGVRTEDTVRASLWREIWTAPFRAMRAVYWMLDPDAQVRSQGEQTVGQVAQRRTKVTVSTDSECGDETTTYTHYLTYRFELGGMSVTREQKVQDLGNLQKGDSVIVYYLRGTHPLRSATAPRPTRHREGSTDRQA